MASDEPNRVPEFYLSTLIVMLLVGGALIYLNISARSLGVNNAETEWGFPAPFYRWTFATAHGSAYPLGIVADAALFFGAMWAAGRIWERLVLKQTRPQREPAGDRVTT